MTIVVAGALCIHFGIVEVGAIWTVKEKAPPDVFRDFPTDGGYGPPDTDIPPPAGPAIAVKLSDDSPTDFTDLNEVALPLAVPTPLVPVMTDPAVAVSVSRRTASPATHPNSAATAKNNGQNRPSGGGGQPGNLAGIPGSGRGVGGASVWRTPKPPYPRMALLGRGQGVTTVRITTDPLGNIQAVEIVRSAGNLLLDRHTQAYVREFWKGPPNATRTTEFVYQIP